MAEVIAVWLKPSDMNGLAALIAIPSCGSVSIHEICWINTFNSNKGQSFSFYTTRHMFSINENKRLSGKKNRLKAHSINYNSLHFN